ncbi:recombinase family protein [Oscillospiraceae bacterium LCP25S3_F9]
MTQQLKKTALYCRLSKDDERQGESLSIETQKSMLVRYAQENGLIPYEIYVDDGYSGLNFDRPDFQRMIDDVATGKIGVVVVKDLSRFGRDHIVVGQYQELYFPSKKVRFIALNDGIDTLNSHSTDYAALKNVINEFYSRDTSRKIKAAFRSRAKDGKYHSKTAPFGYLKDPDNHNHLIPDPETAPVVVKIYDLVLKGWGNHRIRDYLRETKVPVPSWYMHIRGIEDKSHMFPDEESKYIWRPDTLRLLIRNRVYCGDCVLCKSDTVFKTKKHFKTDEADWITVENTHEPIVSRETWERANELVAVKRREYKETLKDDLNIFSGLLKCADCGKALSRRKYGSNSSHMIYVCGTYATYGSHMLLTGFDAPRLKRLYFGRKLKDHNLLQAITRVNRPYKDNKYGYVIDFANIKKNFEETNEAYLRELNRFNDPNEVGAGNETDTFKQVIEDPAALISQMQEVQQVLFNYTTDNAEVFSSEISTIEDKQELLRLKKVLVAARDCCNLVRTFGDEALKEAFAKMELTKLPMLISEVQHHIDNINQKEMFASDDTTKLLVNEAMEDITFNFSKISEEELKLVGGKDAVTEKYKRTVRAFTENIDPDDPEYITLQEAFLQRFKEHGFTPKSITEIEEQGKELDEIIKKLNELQQKNIVLLRKYNGDAKFARVHKRIREENAIRKAAHKEPIVSDFDMSIMNVLLSIKADIDQKVYDKNDILKKDAYFEQTVMNQIKEGMDKLGITNKREDRKFIQSRITRQYLNQYNATYAVA